MPFCGENEGKGQSLTNLNLYIRKNKGTCNMDLKHFVYNSDAGKIQHG